MLLAVAAAPVAGSLVADYGSSEALATWSAQLPLPRAAVRVVQALAVLLTTMLSQAGLWAEVYLITGMVLDAIHGKPPSPRARPRRIRAIGMKKGMVYSGVFMAFCTASTSLWSTPLVRVGRRAIPVALRLRFGAARVPAGQDDHRDLRRQPAVLPPPRARAIAIRSSMSAGLVVGAGSAYAIADGLGQRDDADPRLVRARRRRRGLCRREPPPRLPSSGLPGRGGVALVAGLPRRALLGGFIGAAIGFYLDAAQVAVVVGKFHRYLASAQAAGGLRRLSVAEQVGLHRPGRRHRRREPVVRRGPGRRDQLVDPGLALRHQPHVHGRLFPAASRRRSGRCSRKTGMVDSAAEHDRGPALGPVDVADHQFVPAADGRADLVQPGRRDPHAVAIFQDATMSPEAFRAWSLQVFIYLLAYDAVRILIWLDHMGLRVATLVNLSFLGMDRLDAAAGPFLGPAATARCIPEGVKRFTTWAPLLIPFYIPRGRDWDYAWSQSRGAATGRARRRLMVALRRHRRCWQTARWLAGAVAGGHGVFARRSPASAARRRAAIAAVCRLATPTTRSSLEPKRRSLQPATASAATTSAGGPTICSIPPAGRCFWSTSTEPRESRAGLAADRQFPDRDGPAARGSSRTTTGC